MVEAIQRRVSPHSSLAIATAIAMLALTGQAFGQPQSEPQTAPLSKECQTSAEMVAGQGPLPNTLAALKERKIIKILTIGASASAGTNLATGGYQGIIEATLEKLIPGVDVRIIDRGVSGELARDAVERMKTEVALTEPDLVLWQVGTNDAMAHIPVEEFAEALTSGIKWLKEHNIDVVLVGLHYVRQARMDPHYQAIRSALTRIADAEKVLRIGRYEAMEMIEKMHKGIVPPSEFALEAGYSCVAEYVVRAITSGVFMKKIRR